MVKQGTYGKIPFPDNSADVIIGMFSLHYVLDLDAAFLEMSRVIKKGGKIVFISPRPKEIETPNERHNQVIALPIYNGKVTIHCPAHTLSDFMCPALLSNFKLDSFNEIFDTPCPPVLFVFSATRL